MEGRMAVSEELLALLVCPLCRVKVELVEDKQGLLCPACRRLYPIRDGIPVMLPDEARTE